MRFKVGLSTIAAATCVALSLLATVPASAQSANAIGADGQGADFDRDVFFFGGRFHDGYFGQSFTPWTASFEQNFIVGAGYQQFVTRLGPIRLGGELGFADRFNTEGDTSYGAPVNSVEVWSGVVARLDGFDIGPVHITPSLTAGISVASGLIGVEAERNSEPHSDRLSDGGHFLYYLGPEIAFSLPGVNPDVEVFWRAQHRSGGFGSVAAIDGSNADTVGVRFKF